MKCNQSSEIVAYLKGEIGQAEREPLRLHFEGCVACSRELERLDRTLRALGKLDRVEPSPGFAWRVRQAFASAHPEFLARPRHASWRVFAGLFDFVPAWAFSVAVHVLILAIAAIVLFSPKSEEEELRDLSVQIRPRRPSPPREWPPHADFTPEREPTYTPEGDPFGRKMDPERWVKRSKRDVNFIVFPRGEGQRNRLGGEKVSEALKKALAWLGSGQSGGAWGNDSEHRIGLTGLALLAFLGNGQSHDPAVQFLLGEQKSNGLIGRNEGNYMYGHAIAAIALLEAYVLTRDEALAAPVSAAVAFSVAAQNESGGWGYRFRDPESDTSVGGWHIFLLRLAFAQGDRSGISALNLAHQQLSAVTDEAGKVGYRAPGQFPHGHRALTSVGMISHLLSTHTPDERLLAKQAKLVADSPPVLSTGDSFGNDLYFAYFGSLALFQRGGPEWAEWYDLLKKNLLAAQQPDGSWPAGFDKWSGYGGAVYTTAMAALILETPWRYPRLE